MQSEVDKEKRDVELSLVLGRLGQYEHVSFCYIPIDVQTPHVKIMQTPLEVAQPPGGPDVERPFSFLCM